MFSLLELILRREGNRIVTLPHLKDPGLSRRLSKQSAHALEVHKSWPKVMMKNVASITTSSEAVKEYQFELAIRLRNDGCLLPSLEAGRAYAVMGARPFVLWLPLGYHPWWYRKVKKALTRLNCDHGLSNLLSMAVKSWTNPTVRVAWKNMLPSTDKLLQPNGWRLG